MTGFWAEFMVLFGTWGSDWMLAVLAVPGLLITTMFLLRSVQYGFFGPLNPDYLNVKDADWWELVAFTMLGSAAIFFGIVPSAPDQNGPPDPARVDRRGTVNWSHLLVQFTPELAVLVTAIWVILSDLFLSRHPAGLWRQCFLGLAAATIGTAFLYQVPTPGVELPAMVTRVLLVSQLTTALKFIVLLLSTLAVVFSYRSFEETERHAGEYYSLILFSVLGGLLCISSQDLVLFFISFELLSLPLYMLCGFRRYNSASAEAGLKYFVNGALSSALMLYGISWIYGSTGSHSFGPPWPPSLPISLQTRPAAFCLGCLLML